MTGFKQETDSQEPQLPEPRPPSGALKPEQDILHQRFIILSLVLTLVTTLNYGHPILQGLEQRSGRDNRQRQTRPHIMEALLAILVKDTQILACMTYGNRGIVVQNQSADRLTGDSPADE